MSNTTVIGLFDTADQASAVKNDLISSGISPDRIRTESNSGSSTASVDATATPGKGIWEEIKEMFGGGDDSRYSEYYAEGTKRGGTLVTVSASDEEAELAADILHRHGAIDVDERAVEWEKSGFDAGQRTARVTSNSDKTAPDASALDNGLSGTRSGSFRATDAADKIEASAAATAGGLPESIQTAEEQLTVGKRQVSRGGVRVVRRITETPVEESVNLREERVTIDRRPAGRDMTAAEADAAFVDRTIEVSETGEEAIAAKVARVTGEVIVGKNVTERIEKVRDSVRKSDVEVERLPGQDADQTTSSKITSSETSDADTTSEFIGNTSRRTSSERP